MGDGLSLLSRGLRVLSGRELRTVAQLARAAFPDGAVFPPGASDVDLARAFDAFLADEPAWNRDDLRRALLLLELGPVVFEGRLRTFSRLSPDEALAHFERWSEAGLLVRRQIATALRRFLTLVFYDTPAVWPHIGYGGPGAPCAGRSSISPPARRPGRSRRRSASSARGRRAPRRPGTSRAPGAR